MVDTLVGLGGLVFENVDFLLEEKHFCHPFLFWLFLLIGDFHHGLDDEIIGSDILGSETATGMMIVAISLEAGNRLYPMLQANQLIGNQIR